MAFNLASEFVFVTRFLTFVSILFSTAVSAELVARLLILGILFSTSVILELKSVFLTKLLTSGILFSTVVNTEFAAKLLISGILF